MFFYIFCYLFRTGFQKIIITTEIWKDLFIPGSRAYYSFVIRFFDQRIDVHDPDFSPCVSVQQVIPLIDGEAEETLIPDGLPKGVDVFEINGPSFFGAAYKFKDTMTMMKNPAAILIIRMGNVPMVDATGIRILKEVNAEIKKRGGKLIISEVIKSGQM